MSLVFDPDEAPNPKDWLAANESERISMALRHHKARFPDALHLEGANEIMHSALHAMIETQLASNKPACTGRALERLLGAGLRRHAAAHLLMREMAAQLSSLREGSKAFDPAAWDIAMDRLSATSRPPGPSKPRLSRRERRKRTTRRE